MNDLEKQQLDHILRPDLPWRVADTTECGRSIQDVKSTINRDQFFARLKKHGQARTAFTVCMTCAQTSNRWRTFIQDPVDAMRREVYGGRTEPQLHAELRAMAALVAEHRDEFDGFIRGLQATTSLADHRAQQRLKRS